jgi:hypothetical protein
MRLERLGVEAPPIALGRLGVFKTMELTSSVEAFIDFF